MSLTYNREKRTAELTVQGPSGPQPESAEEIFAAGDQFWPLRAFRELDDALLRLRFQHPKVGLVLLHTRGDVAAVLRADAHLWELRRDWLANEIILHMARVLRRLDQTARSFFAVGTNRASTKASPRARASRPR